MRLCPELHQPWQNLALVSNSLQFVQLQLCTLQARRTAIATQKKITGSLDQSSAAWSLPSEFVIVSERCVIPLLANP